MFLKFLLFNLLLLLCIALFTLWERKILRFAQNRKGPNIVGILGIIQPFRDGIKLLTKTIQFPQRQYTPFSLGAPFIFFFF